MKNLISVLALVVLSGLNALHAQTFTEQANAFGINVTQQMDGGHAWADFDLDGDLDLLVLTRTGTYVYEKINPTFFSLHQFIAGRGQMTAIFADFNNDGYPDICRNESTSAELYLQHPASGHFGDGSPAPSSFAQDLAALMSLTTSIVNTEGGGVFDYDGDGDLDLWYSNHNGGVDILENHVINLGGTDSTGSELFVHATPGDGGIVLGLHQTATTGDYGATADYDNDGWVDICVRQQNQVDIYHNAGGTFPDTRNVDQASETNKGAAAFHDFDNDGDLDLYWTEGGVNQLYRKWSGNVVGFSALGQSSSGITANGTADSIPGQVEGMACGDVDNDGDVDIFLGGSQGRLFLNQLNDPVLGANVGTANTFQIHPQVFDGGIEGCTWVDADEDGDLDLYVNRTLGADANLLYINDLAGVAEDNYLFVKVKENRSTHGFNDLTGAGEERDAIGATVRLLDCDGNPISGIKEVNGGTGHGTMDAPVVHFGLPDGDSTYITVEVSYPNYSTDGGTTVDNRIVVKQKVLPRNEPNHTITIYPTISTNVPPIAVNDTFQICNNTPTVLNVLNGSSGSDPDSDPDGVFENLRIGSIVRNPNNGTVVIQDDSTVLYTPDPGYVDADWFSYVLTDDSNCTTVGAMDTGIVWVAARPYNNAGQDSLYTVCSNEDPFYMIRLVDPTAPPFQINYGLWDGPSTLIGEVFSLLTQFDPGVHSSGVYTYTVPEGACPADTAFVTIDVVTAPNPGTYSGPGISICSDSDPIDLFDQLMDNPGDSGTWSGPSTLGGAVHEGTFDPAVNASGTYRYTVPSLGNGICDTLYAEIPITVYARPNAGISDTITLCSSGDPINLFDSLGGTPDTTGLWIEDGTFLQFGTGHDVVFDPSTDSPGLYFYFVSIHPSCSDSIAYIYVNINQEPNAGTNNSFTICSDEAPFNLFDSLGGTPDATGTWNGGLPGNIGTFTPGSDTAGIYTYTVAGMSPCPDSAATVTVNVNDRPNAGTNRTITICSDEGIFNLYDSLGGTPDITGSWSGPTGLPPGYLGVYNPSGIPPSTYVYTYTVTGVAPCTDSSATVTVIINDRPNGGTDNVITICSSDAPFNLFDSLGGTPDATGSWDGGLVGSAGAFDPSTNLAGVYTYTVAGVAPCADSSATVTVNINQDPDAGISNTFTICSSDAPFNLFDSLGGTPDATGSWNGGLVGSTGLFDPSTDTAGTYTYTVAGVAPCIDASATITININTRPNAGTSNTFTLCSDETPFNLFDSLGGTPDATGSWNGGLVGSTGLFDPSSDTAGTYTYTVTGVAPCADSSAMVTVNINARPNAGTNNTFTLCSDATPFNLFDSLGGTPDATGTWNGGLVGSAGAFDPNTNLAGTYTYTVAGVAPCADSSATVTVNINARPNAGTNNAFTLCSDDAPFNLFDSLGGTPDATGTWDGGLVGSAGAFDPGSDPAGTYTYTVAGVAPCADSLATVTVSINTRPNAGTGGPTTICTLADSVNLFSELGGTPDAGGTWTGPAGSPLTNGDIGTFTVGSNIAGDYTYTVSGVGPCADSSATITVVLNSFANGGTNGSLTVCSDTGLINLFSVLGGTPDIGGSWTPALTGGSLGTFDPTADVPGVYTYTATAAAPCPDSSATVTIGVQVSPNAGENSSISLCSDGVIVNLFDSLGGTPDVTGSWSDPLAAAFGAGNTANFDPSSDIGGAYEYRVAGVGVCDDSVAVVDVTLNARPNAGTNNTITLCSDVGTINLFDSLGGTPDATGTWDGGLPGNLGTFDPSSDTAGIYTYTVLGGAPCADSSATVEVIIHIRPDAGSDGMVTVCSDQDTVNLFDILGDTPDTTGAWSPSLTNGYIGTFDPANNAPANYEYRVAGTSVCADSVAVVTVVTNQRPNAGISSTLTLCSDDDLVDLFDVIAGTPDATGAWTGPSALGGATYEGTFDPTSDTAGVYTYTVTGVAPCADSAITVDVSINQRPDAGMPGVVTFCSNGDPVNLLDSLGITADAGGAWSPGLAGGDLGTFDPGVDVAGVYTYTVAGVAPCADSAATITTIINQLPDAGSDSTIAYCSDDLPSNLFNQLGGTPDTTGIWSGPSTLTGYLGSYDPAFDTAGTYTYTVFGLTACPDVSATMAVTINQLPNAGTNTAVTYCSGSQTVNLIDELGGVPDAGGTWSGPGSISGGDQGTFMPIEGASGLYTYLVSGVSPCPDSAASVMVTVDERPLSGADTVISFCSDEPAVNLFTYLGGDPDSNGYWLGLSNPAGGFQGLYDPSVFPGGEYSYVVPGVSPCPNDTATISITVNTPPNAGNDTSLVVCPRDFPFSILNIINGFPDEGGTWSGVSLLADGDRGTFDPGSNDPGTYVYLVTASGCPDDSSNIDVQISEGVCDKDNDGIVDDLDLDDDNDGILDVDEGDGDSDGDGDLNRLDLDSDGDGIADIIEAGGIDEDNDGEVDYPVAGDPLSMIDNDNDGLTDTLDTDMGGIPLTVPDADGDGLANFMDIDSDGDGIVDIIEAQPSFDYVLPLGMDTDLDGLDDAFDEDDDLTVGIGNGEGVAMNLEDTDLDEVPDYIDTDTDDDNDPDLIEAWDTDNDGTPNVAQSNNDSDGDGLDDAFDKDGTSAVNATGATNDDEPTDFPNLDDPTTFEVDFREVKAPFVISGGFSPNGDGINDTWVISGIEAFQNNSVTIFNRWGSKVYEASPYRNDWDGKNTFGLKSSSGSELPVGVYFYNLNLGTDDQGLIKNQLGRESDRVILGNIYLNK